MSDVVIAIPRPEIEGVLAFVSMLYAMAVFLSDFIPGVILVVSLQDELELLWKGVEKQRLVHLIRDRLPHFLEAVTQAVGV